MQYQKEKMKNSALKCMIISATYGKHIKIFGELSIINETFFFFARSEFHGNTRVIYDEQDLLFKKQ